MRPLPPTAAPRPQNSTRTNSTTTTTGTARQPLYSEPATDEYGYSTLDDDGEEDPFGDQRQHITLKTYPEPSISHRGSQFSDFGADERHRGSQFSDYRGDERSRQSSSKSSLSGSTLADKLASVASIAKERGTEWSKIAMEKSAVYLEKASEYTDKAYIAAKERVDEYRTQNRSPSPEAQSRKESPSFQPKGPSLIFGEPLSLAVSRAPVSDDLPIPIVVYRCIEYLDKEGLTEVGLYRLSGSNVAVNKFKGVFDAADDVDFSSMEERPDPNIAASLVKLYFRELREPILTKELVPEFTQLVSSVQAGSPPNSSVQQDAHLIPELARLCNQLPTENYYTLAYLFRHLHKVSKNNEVNKMTTSNLQVVFTPTLGISSTLIRMMITYWWEIFEKAQHLDGGVSASKQPSSSSQTSSSTKRVAPPPPPSRIGSGSKSDLKPAASSRSNSMNIVSTNSSVANGENNSSPPLAPRPQRPPKPVVVSDARPVSSPGTAPRNNSSSSNSSGGSIRKNPFMQAGIVSTASPSQPMQWNPFGDDVPSKGLDK
ncbi:hypothetical protein SmJEL517_g04150 [Synchytrium microbalum]|uniref:Rho-GAP domain-containing protein n=1 Tax=Synchytrium microbalum TaxID=1806994 RepID=A0A507BV68_9FUNG|nr:uncharacterized protein SmJEL517_g04150 [Synchytrium microbalum]TPX32797.1 hypothetical protein SmJEL517_g04150 [Synchytrium microbalum]